MTNYIQHKWSNKIRIVRETWTSGNLGTFCGKWYWLSTTTTPDLRNERKEDVVCFECRRKAARAVNKKMYFRPTLRKGKDLSKSKRRKLNAYMKQHREHQKQHREHQRLAEWNRAAQGWNSAAQGMQHDLLS